MNAEPVVFIVDDDPKSRNSVCFLVRSMGLNAEPFESAEEFLARYETGQCGCLVTDVRMLGMSGIELLEELNRRAIPIPVIVITAYAKTTLTIRAIKAGAVTLLEKPYSDDDLWDAIRRGLAEGVARKVDCERRADLRARVASLTPAEYRVMGLVVQGKPNKSIARELDTSIRTVEARRSEIFSKMRVESVAELVRLVIEAERENAEPTSEPH